MLREPLLEQHAATRFELLEIVSDEQGRHRFDDLGDAGAELLDRLGDVDRRPAVVDQPARGAFDDGPADELHPRLDTGVDRVVECLDAVPQRRHVIDDAGDGVRACQLIGRRAGFVGESEREGRTRVVDDVVHDAGGDDSPQRMSGNSARRTARAAGAGYASSSVCRYGSSGRSLASSSRFITIFVYDSSTASSEPASGPACGARQAVCRSAGTRAHG